MTIYTTAKLGAAVAFLCGLCIGVIIGVIITKCP